MKQDWTSKIKDKLSDRGVTPPDDLWGAISSRLDSEAITHEKARKGAKIFSWFFVNFLSDKKRRWAYAAAVALIACCVVALMLSRGDKNVAVPDEIVAENQLVEPIDEVVADNEQEAVAPIVEHKRQSVIAVEEPREEAVEENPQYIAQDEPSNDAEDKSIPQATYSDDNLVAINDFDESMMPIERRRVGISLYASNTNFPQSAGDDAFDAFPDPDPAGAETPDEAPIPQPEVLRAEHKQPIRFGVSVSIPLSKRLSLSTGLVYSCLRSDITWLSQTEPYIYSTEQTLHYIGVPIALNINAFAYRKLSLYLTAGAMAEKCVYGNARIAVSGDTERIGERPLQFSLSAGAGLQFSFSRHFSIYAEPLFTYYIDNHSGIVNVYKDRPVNLDLRVGLRYGF